MGKANMLTEMLMIMGFWGFLMQMVLFIGFENHLYDALGLWCGVSVAAGMAIHMKHSIEDVLEIGGDVIVKRMQTDTVRRLAMTGLVIGAVFYFDIGNPLTVLLGLLSLKISAYLQPYVHKKFKNFK